MIPSPAAFLRFRPVILRAWVVLAVFLAVAEPAPAATFEDLYTVSVVPDPDARNIRSDAIRRGMRTLLTRVTGLRQAPDDPRLAGLIADAEVHHTYYGEVSDDEIRIGFRRAPVNEALTGLGLPIWSDERPSTLLWVAMDFGTGQRAEIGAAPDASVTRGGPVEGEASNDLPNDAEEAFEDLTTELLRTADARGLPVVLPRIDPADRQYVRFADVWGGFEPAIERAAERYSVDAILIVRVGITEAGPRVRWILRRGELRQEFETAEAGEGIERLADMFAAEYTIVGGARQSRITIRGIEDWRDYGRVLEYLESLSIVQRVDIESMSADGDLRLRVIARGDDDQLSQVLTLGGVLALPTASPVRPGGDPLGLVFWPSWRLDETAADAP